MKKALITGITGQDGSYLAELLLFKGYDVHGIIRRSSTPNTGRIDHVKEDLKLYYGDLDDDCSLHHILEKVEPDEIYNLGAMSHVRVSFDTPEYTAQATGVSTTRLLEAMRDVCPEARFYQAGSSEMFGKVQENPQKETTPFYPRSPYGCAKVYAHFIAQNYRESYGMHISNGILFNHESPRRGETFVTRKITKWIGDRLNGRNPGPLYLGNLDAKRDWGSAPDYVVAMWRMLQRETPDDYVIATGETHSVREFLELAFAVANTRALDFPFDVDRDVKCDPNLYRPAEVDILLGDPGKANKVLDWYPRTSFRKLVRTMVDWDRGIKTAENLIDTWNWA